MDADLLGECGLGQARVVNRLFQSFAEIVHGSKITEFSDFSEVYTTEKRNPKRMGITESIETPHLRLVAADDAPPPKLQGSRWPIDLRRFPYRPGEMPESLVVPLPSATGELASARARGEGLPLALWARLAIETERAKERVVSVSGHGPIEVWERLRAVGAGWSATTLGLSPLARYAKVVLDAGAAESSRSPGDVEIFIPSEMALCWREAAAASNESLEAWALSAMLGSSPGAGAIEAGAAAAGESLAAWCYAAFLA